MFLQKCVKRLSSPIFYLHFGQPVTTLRIINAKKCILLVQKEKRHYRNLRRLRDIGDLGILTESWRNLMYIVKTKFCGD
jgi:hypothetical protein